MSSPTWQATRRRARRVSARPVLGEIRTAEAYRGDFILQIYAAILLFLLGLLLKPGGTPQVRRRRSELCDGRQMSRGRRVSRRHVLFR